MASVRELASQTGLCAKQRLWLGPSWMTPNAEALLRAALQRNGGKLFSDQLYHMYCRHPWLKTAVGSLARYANSSEVFEYHPRTDSDRPCITLLSAENVEENDMDKIPTCFAGPGKGEASLFKRFLLHKCKMVKQSNANRERSPAAAMASTSSEETLKQLQAYERERMKQSSFRSSQKQHMQKKKNGSHGNQRDKLRPGNPRLSRSHASDEMYSKKFLASQQRGVVTGGPVQYISESHMVYYKHGRELHKFLEFDCVRPTGKETSAKIMKRTLDVVAPEVIKAYSEKQALLKLRCKKAISRQTRLPCAAQASGAESHVDIATFDTATGDNKVAWRLRCDESRSFVHNLSPWQNDVKSKSNLRTVRSGLSCFETKRSVMKAVSPSERNFSKCAGVRRNGVSMCASVRRRIPCEKTRKLQREEDAANRNDSCVQGVLRTLSHKVEDWILCSCFQDSRHILSHRFPGYSNTVYGRVIHAVYERGQLRRRKMKGGGSFNAYGSEGPPLLQISDVDVELFNPQYFSAAIWCSEGSSYKAPLVDDDVSRRTSHDLHGLAMQALRTNADGTCGLHALFGKFPITAHVKGEMLCLDARQLLVSELPRSWEEATSMVNDTTVLDELQRMMWHDFIFPFFAREAPKFLGASAKPTREAEIFLDALSEASPETFQTCKNRVMEIRLLQTDQQLLRGAGAEGFEAAVRESQQEEDALRARHFGKHCSVLWQAYRDSILHPDYWFSNCDLQFLALCFGCRVCICNQRGADGAEAYEIERVVLEGSGPMAIVALDALDAPNGRGHYRRLIPAELLENALTAYFLSSFQSGVAITSQGDNARVAGSLRLDEVRGTLREHRVAEGNKELQKSSCFSNYDVLPVKADGECFLRALEMQLRIDDVVEDFRVLYVLMLEHLMKDKNTKNVKDFVGSQGHEILNSRIRSVIAEKAYNLVWCNMFSYDVYCLDKLEGIMAKTQGLKERHWIDAETDLYPLLRALSASLTMLVPAGDGPSQQKSYVLRGDGLELLDSTANTSSDFLMLHWHEDNFQHFDPVFDKSVSKPRTAPRQVIDRFKRAVSESEMCQAYLNENWAELRASAVKILKLPSSVAEKKSLSHSDLAWGFLQAACSSVKFGRLKIGCTKALERNDDLAQSSLLRSWYTSWDNAILTCAQRGDKETFSSMCRAHYRTKDKPESIQQQDVDDLWLALSSVALPALNEIATALPVKTMRAYRGLRFLDRAEADDCLKTSLLAFQAPTSFSNSLKAACEFAYKKPSLIADICKLPNKTYPMLLICPAQEVAEAPFALKQEEQEVWVRDSCRWQVKTRGSDVDSSDLKGVLQFDEWTYLREQQQQLDIVVLERCHGANADRLHECEPVVADARTALVSPRPQNQTVPTPAVPGPDKHVTGSAVDTAEDYHLLVEKLECELQEQQAMVHELQSVQMKHASNEKQREAFSEQLADYLSKIKEIKARLDQARKRSHLQRSAVASQPHALTEDEQCAQSQSSTKPTPCFLELTKSDSSHGSSELPLKPKRRRWKNCVFAQGSTGGASTAASTGASSYPTGAEVKKLPFESRKAAKKRTLSSGASALRHPPQEKKMALGGLVEADDLSLNFSAELSTHTDPCLQDTSFSIPRKESHVKRSLSRFLDLKKHGSLAGFEIFGFLNKAGELVKDECPHNQHTPIYWTVPGTDHWFCFSQAALHRAEAKNALLSESDWHQLLQTFSENWRFRGFVHDASGERVTGVPPPLFQKTKVRLHTEHGDFDVLALRLKNKIKHEAGVRPSGCKMRLVPKADLGFLHSCSEDTGTEAESEAQLSLRYAWQVREDIPTAVKDCLDEWKDGVVLNTDAKRLLDRHAQSADCNPHIWFCPPSPAEALGVPWCSLLREHHQHPSLSDCWYDQTHRVRRRLSMENVRHNTLPPMDFVRDTVQAWLQEIPMSLRLTSSSPKLADDCSIELESEVFHQKHSMSIKDLRELVKYHRHAREISEALIGPNLERTVRNFFYVGALPKNNEEPATLARLARFLATSSARAMPVQVSLQKQIASFFRLEDYMHVPAAQVHASGNWLVERTSGTTQLRKRQSFVDLEKMWALMKERKLAREDTAELHFKLADFQRNAKRHNVTYLGRAAEEGQLHASILIPDLEDWLMQCSVRLPAILTRKWDQSFVPDHEPLQALVWWKSETALPFQARYGEVSQCLATHTNQYKFDVGAFKDFARLLKLKYLGPLVKHVQVIDGQQTKRSAWQPDEAAIPEQPSSWPLWQRPAYWCFIEKRNAGETRTHHIFRSISELLQHGTSAFHVELHDYQVLAETLGYKYLGTEVTLNDGRVLSSDHSAVLTSKDLSEHNDLCPTDTDHPAFWLDNTSDRVLQRLSYHFLHCKRSSSMPTILSLSAFFQSMPESTEADLEARRVYEGKCTELMFEDLMRNSKVHTQFIKSIKFKMSVSEPVEHESPEATQEEEVQNLGQPSEVQHKFALRQQYSLLSHVVPANVTDKIPVHHGSKTQKLLTYNSSYRCLAEEGRWLVFDQFLVRLEKHFETCVINRHSKALRLKFNYTCTAAIETDLYELLPLPDALREILTQPEDLTNEHKMHCLKQFLHEACSQHNIDVGTSLDVSAAWEEAAEKMLRVASVLSLCLLCTHWEQLKCVNHCLYDIRRLSSLSAEERKLSLTPLREYMCAHCLNLLGKGTGQEPYPSHPQRTDGTECDVYAQPPGILFRSPHSLACCTEVFRLVETGEEPEIHLQPRWQEKPPWVWSLERDGKKGAWTYCNLCLDNAQKKRSSRMPKRNQAELQNTRLYVDRNNELLLEGVTDPTWRIKLGNMTTQQRIDHFERLFLRYEKRKEETERRRNAVLVNEKQFSDPEECWKALQHNEDAFSMKPNPIGANPNPQAMDVETIQELSAGFHPPASVIPSHLLQNLQRSAEYWRGSLVDTYDESLWEDAPHNVPFAKLHSTEANAAVSTVKLYSHFRKSRLITAQGGKQRRLPAFTHVSGNLQCKARFPLEDAGLNSLLIMTDEFREKVMHLKKSEIGHVNDCIKWLQEHNIFSRVYKSNWDKLQQELSTSSPESMLPCTDSADIMLGNNVRASTALGHNEMMIATVDISQYRDQYSKLAQQLSDVGGVEARGGVAARNMDKLTRVSARDVNLDAKTFAPLYPWGSGSLNSIENCVDGNTYAKQLLHDISPNFRQCELWAPLQQDRKLKQSLTNFNNFVSKPEEKAKAKKVLEETKPFHREHGKLISRQVAEKGTKRQRAYYTHNYGTEVSRNIVGSDAYMRSSRQNLLTMIRPENQGPPHGMITYVCNHQAAEILAEIRRGPFAKPTMYDRLGPQFLSATLKPKDLPNTFEHPAIVAISYQKRRSAFRARAMRCGSFDTLIATLTQDINRTEEQKSRNLHDHTPYYCEPCSGKKGCSASRFCVHNPLCKLPSHIKESSEDYVHKKLHHAEVRAELVRFARPDTVYVSPEDTRGHATRETTFESSMTTDDLFVAFQQRCVQTRWMIHKHSLGYCLKCGKCRFFFPFCECKEQKHDDTINRMLHVRRHAEDDSMVATHILESLLVANTHVHAQVFCPTKGSRLAGLYTVVYIAKKDPEARLNTVHTEDTDVSLLLKVRTMGLPMMWYFINGGQLFDLNRDVLFFPCLFESQGYFLQSWGRLFAAVKGQAKVQIRCNTATEKYLWRPSLARHLRVDQLVRYFCTSTMKRKAATEDETKLLPSRGFTKAWREVHDLADDERHPNFDARCAALPPGKIIAYEQKDCAHLCLVKRSTRAYGCLRTFTFPPTSDLNKQHNTTNRDLFFQQRLFMHLPWYCVPGGRVKLTVKLCRLLVDGNVEDSPTSTDLYLDQLRKDTTDGSDRVSHEAMCKRVERIFASTVCECCDSKRPVPCELCGHIFQRVGWHRCKHEDHLVWKAGTLWDENSDAMSEQFLLDMKARGDSFKRIQSRAEDFVLDGILSQETADKLLVAMSADMNEKELYRTWDDVEEDASASNTAATREEVQKQLDSDVLAYETRLNSVWCFRTEKYVEPEQPTSQYKAYKQLVLRQQRGKPMFIIIHAEAGYGKSDLIMAFMLHEQKHGREWVKLAPSGVAALNVKGFTLHFFLRMDDQYKVNIQKDSEEARRLEAVTGIIIDEFLMNDVEAFKVLQETCRLFPLPCEKRKVHAFPEFGYRCVLLIGDVFQMPPASGLAPIVVTSLFQKKFEVFYLKENRRQEKKPAYGKILNSIRCGGGVQWEEPGQESIKGEVLPEVRTFLVDRYVAGWGVNATTVDLEKGRTLTSFRRDKDSWCRSINDRIAKKFPDCEAIDITCCYQEGSKLTVYTKDNIDHDKAKHQFPKILQIRTHPEHRARLTLLKNIDVFKKQLANGTSVRALPFDSWSRSVVCKPRQDANGGKPGIKQLSAERMEEFQMHFTKEGVSDAQAKVGNAQVTSLSWAEQKVMNDVMGNVRQIPIESGYASSIHKSQGLTLTRVHGLLEGIFAHGQTYVLISRTPDADQFWLIGVPPEDILLDVMQAVESQRCIAKRFLQEYESLDERAKVAVTETGTEISASLLPLREHIARVWDRHTRSKPLPDMCTNEVKGLLIEEDQRLDLDAGVESMITVTHRFTSGTKPERLSAKGSVTKLHSLVKYTQKMKDRSGKVRPWLTLKEALSPEPRASSTYYCIDQWLLAVDLLQRATVDDLCEDTRESDGTLVRSVPFLHGRELPDPETRWWGGFVEEQMREKEAPLPKREVDLSPLLAACAGKQTETADATSVTRLPAGAYKKPLQTGAKGSTPTQLFVKCPKFCKQELAVDDLKLTKRNDGRVLWNCNRCWQLEKKQKQVKITCSQLVCVQCSNASGKECSLESCPIGCPTKQAVDKMKDAVVPTRKKAEPILPIAVGTLKDKGKPKGSAATRNDVDVANTTVNPFPPGHTGLCPHCLKAADVSAFKVDQQYRVWCSHKECKSRAVITHWFCIKCSGKANAQGKAGKNVKVKFADCVCYAKLLSLQGKVVLSCPQTTCRGWKEYDDLPASSDIRITCGVCSVKKPVGTWHCFACNMIRSECICKRSEVPEARTAHKRPASVLKRPAQKRMPTSTSKRCRR